MTTEVEPPCVLDPNKDLWVEVCLSLPGVTTGKTSMYTVAYHSAPRVLMSSLSVFHSDYSAQTSTVGRLSPVLYWSAHTNTVGRLSPVLYWSALTSTVLVGSHMVPGRPTGTSSVVCLPLGGQHT